MAHNLRSDSLGPKPEEKSEFRGITDASPDGGGGVNSAGQIQFANPAAASMFGRSAEELKGTVFGYPVMASDRTELTIGTHQVEMRVGRASWGGEPAFLASLRDMTQRAEAEANMKGLSTALEEANQQLQRLATIDPLTETLNRRGIENALWNELERDRRYGSNLVAVMLSCDDLKEIIENLGHAVGDVLLKTIAERLQTALRPSDQIARISRDKFLVFLPDTRVAEGRQVADKLRHAVGSTPLALSPHPLSVNMGIAVVQAPKETCSIEEILELAHSALKTESEPEEEVNVQAPTLTIATPTVGSLLDLTTAIEEGSFHAVSQPILELQGEEVVGHELLSRGPAGALEMPVDFFRIALESNMLASVDLSCLKACVDVSKRLTPRGKLHVNLFPSTILGTPSERLMDLLATTDEGVTFCIEISEQQFIGDPACLREHVAAFKEKGIEVSIDDVGFGRSCLETLIMLEPDVVKIDRAYVDGASRDPNKGRLLARLVEVAKTLGAEIVAEGIESRDDLSLLRDYGVRYGQGWLWGKPGRSYIEYQQAS